MTFVKIERQGKHASRYWKLESINCSDEQPWRRINVAFVLHSFPRFFHVKIDSRSGLASLSIFILSCEPSQNEQKSYFEFCCFYRAIFSWYYSCHSCFILSRSTSFVFLMPPLSYYRSDRIIVNKCHSIVKSRFRWDYDLLRWQFWETMHFCACTWKCW